MPYIKPEGRQWLDRPIDELVEAIQSGNKMTDEEFLSICGEINYTISSFIGKLIDEPSYSKIAMITGVLENIKQEFYRRIASPYETNKMVQNGDIKAYRRLYP